VRRTDFRQMIDKASTEAKAINNEIDVLASLLAEKMQRAHGDEFRIQIDHKVKLVLVVPWGGR
jgi:hypothetical protein